MSMSWDYKCSKCGKEYCVMHPDPYGFPNICGDCWTDEDTKKLNKFEEDWEKEDAKRQREYTAEGKLDKIPKWIRNIFGAI